MRSLILNKEVILEELAQTANGPSFRTRKSYKMTACKTAYRTLQLKFENGP